MSTGFGSLLKEKLDELADHEATIERLANDPVEKLKAEALEHLPERGQGYTPWHSPGRYEDHDTVKMTETSKLDVRG